MWGVCALFREARAKLSTGSSEPDTVVATVTIDCMSTVLNFHSDQSPEEPMKVLIRNRSRECVFDNSLLKFCCYVSIKNIGVLSALAFLCL